MATQPATDAEQRPRQRRRARIGELRRQPPDLGGVRRRRSAQAEERGVAEGEQPDIADQQVEGAGKQREAQHLHQEHRVERTTADDDQAASATERAEEAAAPWLRRRDAAGGGRRRRPSQRPSEQAGGPTSSTMAMMTKMTVLEASG